MLSGKSSVSSQPVAAVTFTGHKSLSGPTGIGGLVLRKGLDVRPTRFGGTGFESWSSAHPEEHPYRLEAGTLNVLGIIGLAVGLRYITQHGIEGIYDHEMSLAATLREGLASIDTVQLYCADRLENHISLLTSNVENLDPEDFAAILDGDFGPAPGAACTVRRWCTRIWRPARPEESDSAWDRATPLRTFQPR